MNILYTVYLILGIGISSDNFQLARKPKDACLIADNSHGKVISLRFYEEIKDDKIKQGILWGEVTCKVDVSFVLPEGHPEEKK